MGGHGQGCRRRRGVWVDVGRTRPASRGRWLHAALLVQAVIALSVAAPPCASGQDKPFTICDRQRYALCATARCFVYDQVAYCKCEIEFGSSISESDTVDDRDICSYNRQGYLNGYMMSTYSLPADVEVGGDKALYTCPGATSSGAYAQCDGGVCFSSTRARRFPGFRERLKSDEIICSCPITVADPGSQTPGYQIVGPYPCRAEFFDNCNSMSANTNNGSTIIVGAPTGTPRFLTRMLDGKVPRLNHCE